MKKLLLLIVTLLLSSPALAEDSISLLTEEFAPYQFYEGEGDNKIITGISIEIGVIVKSSVSPSESCGGLIGFCYFYSVFELDPGYHFTKIVKAA